VSGYGFGFDFDFDRDADLHRGFEAPRTTRCILEGSWHKSKSKAKSNPPT
jgi:hypothetical protein